MDRRRYSKLQLILLKLLSERPMHGYALMREVEELLGSRPSPGTIYPLLREMLREGLVEVRVSGVSGRIVKTYYITEKGRQYLASRSGELEELLLFVEGVRLARTSGGPSLEEVVGSIVRLVRLLPRLPEEGRLRILDFLARVVREAERLMEEVEQLAGI